MSMNENNPLLGAATATCGARHAVDRAASCYSGYVCSVCTSTALAQESRSLSTKREEGKGKVNDVVVIEVHLTAWADP